MKLLHLPYELLLLIFDELTMVDLVKISCTCHSIQNMIWTDKLIKNYERFQKILNSMSLDPKKIKHSEQMIQITRTLGNSDIIFEKTYNIYYLTISTNGQVVFPKSLYQIHYIEKMSGKRTDYIIDGSFYEPYRRILTQQYHKSHLVPYFLVKDEVAKMSNILTIISDILCTKYKNFQ